MNVTVRYHAVLRDIAGQTEETVEVQEPCTGTALLQSVVVRHPDLIPYIHVIRLATETEYVDTDAHLEPDAVIALIPPVSGG